ncbi:MAG: redoxin domain-containing protein [Chloroflexi bacterium]|nr:redoxin domain-containing protein [Chloroflexota bacterium]
MNNDVTIGLAFIAGVFSFISPCVLPLVPAYIGYMGGRVTRQVRQENAQPALRQRFGTFTHGLFFVAGFTLFFVLFGLLTTAAVSSLTSLGVTESEVKTGIAHIGGTAVILFGLHILGILNRVFIWLQKQAPRLDQNPYGNLISVLIAVALLGGVYWLLLESWFLTLVAVLLFTQVFHDALKTDKPGEFWGSVITRIQIMLYVDTRRQTRPDSRYGYMGSLLMGVVFSAGWTPCIGPIYGAILTLASTEQSLTEAGTLLFAYSLGLGIPFLLTALALDQAQGVLRRLQRNMRAIEAISGSFLILMGVLVFSGQLQRLSQVGTEGSFGEISLNLENCMVGAVEGEVRWANVMDCIGDGVKEDFYVTAPKPVAQVPAISDAASSEGGLEVPTLGANSAENAVIVPELVPGSAAVQPTPADQAASDLNVPVGLAVGRRAPDFTAQLLDGQTVSLVDFRGQVVLINFWATWCGPCREEMPDFQTAYDLYQDQGFTVLAVNYREGSSTVGAFADELELTFPIALDESGAINEDLYRDAIVGYPTSFLVDTNGVIVKYFPGIVPGSELLDALGDLLAH